MNKRFRSISFILVLSVLLTFLASTTVFAAEKKINIADSKGHILLSDFKEEKALEGVQLFTVNGSVTITFNADDISRESINLLKDPKNLWGDSEEIKFAVKKYKYYEGKEIFDEATTEATDLPYYVSGNYAKLTKPGTYLVNASVIGSAGTNILIQITDSKTTEVKSITKLELATELVKLAGVEKTVTKDKTKLAKLCTYKDVAAASKHYVGYAVSKGWITAKSKTDFGIKDAATPDMSAKAVLKAAGKATSAANVKAIIGKNTKTKVTKELLKTMYTAAKKLKK